MLLADIRITHELLGQLNKAGRTWSPDVVPAGLLHDIIVAVEGGKLTGTVGRAVLKHVVTSESTPGGLEDLLKELGIAPAAAEDLRATCEAAIAKLPKEADKVRKGNEKVVMRLVGEVMKMSEGSADAKRARELLLEILK